MDDNTKRAILKFMNSDQGRALRGSVGSLLMARGGNLIIRGLGAVLAASAPMDFCPTNVAFGYPLSGEETRKQLAEA